MLPEKYKIWLNAFRLRTLPLSFSCVIVGSALAFAYGNLSIIVLILTLSTTLCLQILSNLANDYGDGVKGTDNYSRIGPVRTIQNGSITQKSMKAAIVVFILFSLTSGIGLVYFGLKGVSFGIIGIFLLLGIGAIVASVKYTVGRKAYGYYGMGDVFVFIFFGLIGVAGTYYLHTHIFNQYILLPAASIGFLSVGVLNLNNMRDIESDKLSGKNTIPVNIGQRKSKLYHTILLLLAILAILIYVIAGYSSIYQLTFLLVSPLIFINIFKVWQVKDLALYDGLLKKLAISTFIFSIIFSIGIMIS